MFLSVVWLQLLRRYWVINVLLVFGVIGYSVIAAALTVRLRDWLNAPEFTNSTWLLLALLWPLWPLVALAIWMFDLTGDREG